MRGPGAATAGPDGGKAAYADDWAALDSVEIVDKYKGRLHLKQPSPGLWVITLCDGSGYILSKKAVEALNHATEEFAARRMDEGIKRALAGRKIGSL